ncbi:MAG: hypothetical protein QOF59_2229 [Actinomycetota bacterium]|jgi:hypothetical protein|nr:hypothetical protein [Actinomycetota bacterium]
MSSTRYGPSPRTLEAARVVAAQLGCDDQEALRRLRERAESLQYRVHSYAQMVIDGLIRFDL